MGDVIGNKNMSLFAKRTNQPAGEIPKEHTPFTSEPNRQCNFDPERSGFSRKSGLLVCQHPAGWWLVSLGGSAAKFENRTRPACMSISLVKIFFL